MAKKPASPKTVATLQHEEAKRKNIPTAEFQSVLKPDEQKPVEKRYPRNTDLDPQLVWRGKDEQDWSDLVVHAPPVYIQEKVHPKALIDDLLRATKEREHEAGMLTPDLFADFNGIPKGADKTDFYQHDQNWSNRMILGDSLLITSACQQVGSPPTRVIGLLSPSEIFWADEGRVILSASNQAALKMDNAATAAAGNAVSMWQTGAIALKAVRESSWYARAGSGAYFVAGF